MSQLPSVSAPTRLPRPLHRRRRESPRSWAPHLCSPTPWRSLREWHRSLRSLQRTCTATSTTGRAGLVTCSRSGSFPIAPTVRSTRSPLVREDGTRGPLPSSARGRTLSTSSSTRPTHRSSSRARPAIWLLSRPLWPRPRPRLSLVLASRLRARASRPHSTSTSATPTAMHCKLRIPPSQWSSRRVAWFSTRLSPLLASSACLGTLTRSSTLQPSREPLTSLSLFPRARSQPLLLWSDRDSPARPRPLSSTTLRRLL